MSVRRDFDVLIAGAGMVGAALAARLATGERTRELRVALVEPAPVLAPLPGEPLDLRVSALSRAGECLLRDVGAWPAVRARGACAYERMLIWDAAGRVDGADTLAFDAAELGEPDLGHIVENRAVAAALLERALDRGVTLIRERATGLEPGADVATLALGERRLRAGLVVAADGADSPLRALAGLAGEVSRYPAEAVVAHLHPERPHGHAARQRFLPDGPLGMLPLADGRLSIVWSTTPAEAERLVGLEPEAFAAAVTEASDGVLGALETASPCARFPLRRFHAAGYTATRFALLGDAAHTVHPLAGQGVNQGFLDVLALAAEIETAVAAGEDPGDARALGRYARARRTGNALMGAALDALYRGFTDPRESVRRARRAGLGIVNAAAPLKRLLVARALGAP
ncbi:MAG: FAD-dependent oxidoreductase [Proteobacteria bacterium]|nr:FAD-dependent oxidoreductase [Pseudomonadota bacterium]